MGTLAADTFTAGNASFSFYAQQTALTDFWHLWSYYSWKDVAVSSTFLLTAALLGHVAATTGSNETWSLARGAVGFGVGFFVPRTATKYPTIKYQNTIRTDILSLYCTIGKKLLNFADRFPVLAESLENNETTDTEQLVSLIKKNAKLSYEFSLNKNLNNEFLLKFLAKMKIAQKNTHY
ncbi:MAG: hypothetical protein PSV35_09460 [bacterium]|nr:hypothetical protein [bacterium]